MVSEFRAFVFRGNVIDSAVVEPSNAIAARRASPEQQGGPAAPAEAELLAEIRDELRRRP
jgi:large-conductance mechanosensitive channel